VKKKKLGAGFEKLIGEPIPLKGQPRKMFTFCTRTVYLGADFYSDNARTFILSDANIDSLAVDISLDLPQILGRQRLNENPWRNRGEFYYKINGKEIPREEFDDKVRKKDETTAKKLENFQQVPHKDVQISDFEKVIKLENYKDDYVVLKRELKKLDRHIPPLVNSYMNVSPTMIAFDSTVNEEFGNVYETGLLVTTADMYEEKVKRHMEF
jgi:archaellum component FlaC